VSLYYVLSVTAFKIASWNVAGLRAVIKKNPTALIDLCEKHNLDMLCLQETKLQEIHLEDPKLKIKGLMEPYGYDEHWSCSTVKKGYSGTAVFVKRRTIKGDLSSKKSKQTKIANFFATSDEAKPKAKEAASKAAMDLPVNSELLVPTAVTDKLGKEIDNEGRSIILEFPWGTIANVYVPNSGQNLERLDFRTKEWDKFFLGHMQKKHQQRGLPVMWLGDLNIAHQAHDIWNDGAKHLDKQAGVTPQERASFTEQLEAGFVDAFRKLHPGAKGHYSYWSQRAGNREPNKGLRLDYFVCSPEFFDDNSKVIARDSYMIPDQMGSDHCPIVLELEIKP
jgi:exodeoxyribonuclease-3